MSETTRRSVLAGAAGIGAAAMLAACGSDDSTSTDSSSNNGAAPQGNNTGAAPTQGGQNGAGTAIKKSDIPVGGGVIFKEQNVVVTQPTAGQFKAFSATCTHNNCPVATVSGGTINCNCHFSKFSVADGSVKGGPAPKPLPAKTVTDNGDSLTVA
jgi:Rieske Fe-S protein